MDKLSYEDQVMLYRNAVLRYKGRIVFVFEIQRGDVIGIKDLRTKEKEHVLFNRADFQPALGRIGFVNCDSLARYLTRMPVRRYNVGITRENTQVYHLDYHRRGMGDKLIEDMSEEDKYPIPSKGLALALDNVYPSFEEAAYLVQKRRNSVAFDKQFAICLNNVVYFKMQRVGLLPKGKVSLDDVVWDKGQDYLRSIIGNCDAKTIRAFKSA